MGMSFVWGSSSENSVTRKKPQGSSDRCDFSCGHTVDRSGGLQGSCLELQHNTVARGSPARKTVSMGTAGSTMPGGRLHLFLWYLSPWHLLALKNRLKTEHEKMGEGQPTSPLSPSVPAAVAPSDRHVALLQAWPASGDHGLIVD